ncbi:MAG: hypothetical protein JGK37_30790 [Microcoleus sp. PH2017_06_SFM_O_A]|nr:hypothetical protein [Microcoleus sp. PH2017_06_SFM_O_A]
MVARNRVFVTDLVTTPRFRKKPGFLDFGLWVGGEKPGFCDRLGDNSQLSEKTRFLWF